MAENEFGAEKTEDPTPRRLEEARGEGQVAFSPEVTTAVLLLTGFAVIGVTAPWFWQAACDCMRWGLRDGLNTELDATRAMRAMADCIRPFLPWLLAFLAILFLAALGTCVAQVGWHVSTKPLIPKWERLDPVTGMQRLLGLRGLMRLGTNLLKLSLIIWVAWIAIAGWLPQEVVMTHEIAPRFAHEAHHMWWLGLLLAGALALIAAVDYGYQRWQHHRDLMMTRQEVKEEMKQSEGDPLMKGRIRQVQRQIAQRRMMQEVPKADVVITNPTHVAVALKYDKDKMAAPTVVAKGYDEVAQKIKAIAAEHRVTMVENVALARALAKDCDIGEQVPVKWYQQVAEVLAMVYKLKRAA